MSPNPNVCDRCVAEQRNAHAEVIVGLGNHYTYNSFLCHGYRVPVWCRYQLEHIISQGTFTPRLQVPTFSHTISEAQTERLYVNFEEKD